MAALRRMASLASRTGRVAALYADERARAGRLAQPIVDLLALVTAIRTVVEVRRLPSRAHALSTERSSDAA